ncbi:MAG: hypothetical protein IPG99_19360 [Ignavibacteria bacterium]|nr:hypothetical protein [Ignavibacteria bacterium]
MDNIPDVTMSGETVGGRYGWIVSTAGDVNGDGYSRCDSRCGSIFFCQG